MSPGDKSKSKVVQGTNLRQRAQAMVDTSAADVSSMAKDEIQRLVYELQVHQVELELQNEELREAQLELAASRDSLADLYDFAPTGYLTLDARGLILEANLTAAKLVGIERDSMLGTSLSDFVLPHCQDSAYLYLRQAFSSARKQVCELEIQRSDGTTLIVMLEGKLRVPHSGRGPECRVGMIDISDLRRTQDDLSALNMELEQRVEAQVGEIRLMANAIANLGEGVLITSDHGEWLESRIEFVNQALCGMLGYSAEELIDQSPALLLGDQFDMAFVNTELASKGYFRGELVYQTSTGAQLDVELYINILQLPGLDRIRYVAVQRDISDRKQAERALREQQERLRAILDSALDVIVTIDGWGIVRDCNFAIESVFGYTVDEVIGRNISMLMPSPYREKHDSYLRRYRDTGESRIIGRTREFRARHRDGHSFPISLSINRVDGLGLFTGIIEDVSELRKLQRQVLGAAEDVQRYIGQALHDGPQQALAGLSLVARGLALDLGHEGSAHGAAVAKLADELKQANSDIRLLAQGLVPVYPGSDGLADSLAALSQKTSEDHDLIVEFHCPEPVDIQDSYTASQLYLIAQEAIMNAVKHARADRIRISLLCQGQGLLLRVEDNGIGIDAANRAVAGLGMHIMPYRAATIGATVVVSRVATGGTLVSCELEHTLENPF